MVPGRNEREKEKGSALKDLNITIRTSNNAKKTKENER